jgi:hypothetical protein
MMGMEAGTTFLLAKDSQLQEDHLWLVLSDTQKYPEQVVIVNLTTYAPEKDGACIVEAGEHPWVRRKSCVSYYHAKVVTLTMLLKWKDQGLIVLQDPLSSGLLGRMRQRSGDSTTLPSEKVDILIEQSIICLDD